MKIVSFTGKSGTGKSYQATRLCRMKNIEAIIDDGLLIHKNRIVAGRSAKKSETKAGAMRAALFAYDDQREEVRNKLLEINPAKLLVIGTSDKMVDRICDTLEIGEPAERVYIEDMTTSEEREIAKESREGHGEHVIPAPLGQLKREFAGYFINPVRMIKGMTMSDGPVVQGQATDRTVVRPQYSYFGNFQISEKCLKDIIYIAAEPHQSAVRVKDYYHNHNQNSLNMVIEVKVRPFTDVVDRCEIFQKEVSEMIEQMTSFQMGHVNIEIKDIALPVDNLKNSKAPKFKTKKEDKRPHKTTIILKDVE